MDRDWDAERAEVDGEFHAAKAARDKAHELVRPELGNMRKFVSVEDLAAFEETSKRFKAAVARRSAFLTEQKNFDSTWGMWLQST